MLAKDLFKKESHYAWTMAVLVLCHVLFMTYIFPSTWADTPQALTFVDRMASIVPAINNLKPHALASATSTFWEKFSSNFFAGTPPFTNYWGMFYAIFWVMAPLFLLFGFVGSFFLSKHRYDMLIAQNSRAMLFMGCVLFSAISLFVFEVPMLPSGMPLLSPGGLFNQMSTFLPKLIWSWGITAGILYCQGKWYGGLLQKINLNKKH